MKARRVVSVEDMVFVVGCGRVDFLWSKGHSQVVVMG